ncbi:uncharacterized protein EV422DRAFT_16348 [Fimicolochytrium jonesii]|uniref:uncharacterized protein n=1 Tax=Fimicolochytrium jonesii TaxID=1396493 RepID=UPI0022FE3755|nr:uncharacterized protein EV422DRAFT_16348 [Fimicolochytrium jonesii]KAI8826878.1 hypothetical protein EV422DRAFT_16348 [Fimicolochytrium jonesii]
MDCSQGDLLAATTATIPAPLKSSSNSRGERSQDTLPPVSQPQRKRFQVRFDREKIRSLSGSDKVDLFRDYIKCHQADDALYVYTILKQNDLNVRLKYDDYHGFFHTLITNPNKYRDAINTLVSDMRRYGYKPSDNFLMDLLVCCKRCGDFDTAMSVYDELKAAKRAISLQGYNALLDLCTHHGGLAQRQRGVDIWSEMLASSTPNFCLDSESYRIGMELFGKLSNSSEVDSIYARAITEWKKHRVATLQPTAAASRIHIDNAYLGVLVNTAQYSRAKTLFDRYYLPGAPLHGDKAFSLAALRRTLNILLKMCEATRDYPLAHVYWTDFTRRGVHPDAVAYGRMITLSSHDLVLAQEYFEKAVQVHGADANIRKLTKLRTALLAAHALSPSGDIKVAYELYEGIRNDAGGKVPRSAVGSMVGMCLRARDLPMALGVWERAGVEGGIVLGAGEEKEGREVREMADVVAAYRRMWPGQ